MPPPTLIQTIHNGGPGSQQQWAHDFALYFQNLLSNGQTGHPIFANTLFAQFGIQPFNSSDIGQPGAAVPMTQGAYNQLYQLGQQIAAGGWNQLTPEQQQGLTNPTGLPSAPGGATSDPSEVDYQRDRESAAEDHQRQLAIENLVQAGMDRRQAQEMASRMSIAQLQEAGANSRSAAQIASNERISGNEIRSREGIAAADRAESGRQFDLRLGEDRRQFNSSMLFNLLDRGVELAKAPVDWIAYQYWLENMDIPVSSLTLSSAATMFGTVPPSGPSAVGPVVGGPAIIDGDTSTAQQLGITNPGPMSITEAVQAFPGGMGSAINDPELRSWTSDATVQKFGGASQVDMRLAEARQTELPQAMGGDSPFVQQAAQVSQNASRIAAAGAQTPLAGDVGQEMPFTLGSGVPPPAGTGQEGVAPGMPPGMEQPVPMRGDYLNPPGGPFTNLGPGAEGGFPPGAPGTEGVAAPGQPLGPMTAPVGGGVTVPGAANPGAPGPMTAPPAPSLQPATNVAGATGGSAGGIYTGNEAGGTPPQSAVAPGQAPNNNIEQLLAQLSAQLGIPIEQIRQLFPANLMGGQYNQNVIANSPVIQSLRTGNPLSGFNTGPRTGSPFTNIRSMGIETGIRGGQDVNATTFLTANPSQREMMAGAIRATGQYLPDVQYQMQRSAPITNIDPGSFGRRRF